MKPVEAIYLSTINLNSNVLDMVCADGLLGIKYGNGWDIGSEFIGNVTDLNLLNSFAKYNQNSYCIIGNMINGTRMLYENGMWENSGYLDCSGTRLIIGPFSNVKSFINGGSLYGSWDNNGGSVYMNNRWNTITTESVKGMYLMESGILVQFANSSVGLFADTLEIIPELTGAVCGYKNQIYAYNNMVVDMYRLQKMRKPYFGHISVGSNNAMLSNSTLPSAIFMDMGDIVTIHISSHFDDIYEFSVNGANNIYISKQKKTFSSNWKTIIWIKVDQSTENIPTGDIISNGILTMTCTGNCMFKSNTATSLKFSYISIFTGCPLNSALSVNNGHLSVEYDLAFQFKMIVLPSKTALAPNNIVTAKLVKYRINSMAEQPIKSAQTDLWASDHGQDSIDLITISPNSKLYFVCASGTECGDIINFQAFPNPLELYLTVEIESEIQNSFCKLTTQVDIQIYGIGLSNTNTVIIAGISFVFSVLFVLALSFKKYHEEILKIKNKELQQ